ncbi:Hypothetical protein R9X50_00413500 [Acrodontium crateriforme]|uniref:FAD-binding PCMH-type domain-containing protein n=1 Tax=Acrodontium crateriforme TaxID=150365 RepID=A0AAQ3M5I3_9PEZI|nr:Hypothetical protein R9X50_00413500 [Acrodontium crateriforme]
MKMLKLILVAPLCFAASVVSGVTFGCKQACLELSNFDVSRSTGNTALSSLWSNFQAEVEPECRLVPRHNRDVAEILRVIRKFNCHFAVLGGGTSPFKGASNADAGITIDMQSLRDLDVVDGENAHVVVGAGNLWAHVYAALAPFNMSATGTRNSLTGVIGSILGGGILFFSEAHGWACDTVIEFELVLANSSVILANEHQNPEIFWALRGGGNNFGIVTRVSIEAFKNPPTWYTFQRFSPDHMDLVFNRLEAHTNSMPNDVCQIAVTFQWHVPTDQFVVSERMVAYELPELPEILWRKDSQGKLEPVSVLQTVSYQRSILAMAEKMDQMNPHGFFNLFGSLTVYNDSDLFTMLARVFMAEIEHIKTIEGLQVYIVYNPLTSKALSHMQKRGGNALGLESRDGPLTIININLHWSKQNDNDQMYVFMRNLIKGLRSTAVQKGLLHPYLFQNHAFEEENLFDGYGVVNVGRLRTLQKILDPDRVFQALQPGGFKLWADQVDDAQWDKSEL